MMKEYIEEAEKALLQPITDIRLYLIKGKAFIFMT